MVSPEVQFETEKKIPINCSTNKMRVRREREKKDPRTTWTWTEIRIIRKIDLIRYISNNNNNSPTDEKRERETFFCHKRKKESKRSSKGKIMHSFVVHRIKINSGTLIKNCGPFAFCSVRFFFLSFFSSFFFIHSNGAKCARWFCFVFCRIILN